MEFDLRFTGKEITAWGGMGLMKRMLDHLGFESALPLDVWPTVHQRHHARSGFHRDDALRRATRRGARLQSGHTLQTLRYKLFAKAAYITTESRKPILNLALAMQQRAWMQGLWDAAKSFDLPAKFTPIYSP